MKKDRRPKAIRKEKHRRVLLIDGDVLVYQAACAAEQETCWEEDWATLHSDLKEVRGRLEHKLSLLSSMLGTKEFRVALSVPTETNFRRKLDPLYKHRRKRKPVAYKKAREYLIEKYSAIMFPSLEADDVLGILATEPQDHEERIIVSVDKDYRTLPAVVFNPDRPERGLMASTPAEAEHFHFMQTLTGDYVDDIPGCPGIGPKKAAQALVGLRGAEAWAKVEELFTKAGLTPQAALNTTRLTHLLQWGEYDTKTGKVTLWTPPS